MTGFAPLVIIDGRAGSGKTSLAELLCAEIPETQVIHMDDLTPGWRGLRKSSAALLTLLRTGVTQSFDWIAGQTGDLISVDPALPLIVEGCGSLTRSTRRFAALTVWMDDERDLRQQRAIHRDGERFAARWDLWERQETQHIRIERPDHLADIVWDGRRDTLLECSKLLSSSLDLAATSEQFSKRAPRGHSMPELSQ